MKIAAIADIHGNYQALIAAIDHIESWKPDQVLVLGDIINRGPRSPDCLHLIQEKVKTDDWKIIKGNHEGYVLNFTAPDFPWGGLDFELRKIIYWTFQSLNENDIQSVADMPEKLDLVLQDNQLIRGLHASTAGDRVGIYPDSSDSDLENLVDSKADVFLIGHTHQPFHKGISRELLSSILDRLVCHSMAINGLRTPRLPLGKGGWAGEIIRIDYDLPAAVGDYEQSGFIPDGGPLAELVLAELKLGWPQLSHWFRQYESRVLGGEISLDQAVTEYLQNPSIEQSRTDIPMIYPL